MTLTADTYAVRFADIVRRELEQQVGDVLAENAALKRKLQHQSDEIARLRADLAALRPQGRGYDANGIRKV